MMFSLYSRRLRGPGAAGAGQHDLRADGGAGDVAGAGGSADSLAAGGVVETRGGQLDTPRGDVSSPSAKHLRWVSDWMPA